MPRGSNNQKITREQAVEALREANGVVAEAARLLGVSRNSIINHRKKAIVEGMDVPLPPVDFSKGDCDPNSITSRVKAAEQESGDAEEDPRPLTGGRVDPIEIVRRPLPKKRQVKTYIVTGAVNNTDIHLSLWSNIEALAAHYDAEIIVRPILYNLNAYRRMGADTEDVQAEEGADIHFDAAVKPYFRAAVSSLLLVFISLAMRRSRQRRLLRSRGIRPSLERHPGSSRQRASRWRRSRQ